MDEGPARLWKPKGEQVGGNWVEQMAEEAMEELTVGGAMLEMMLKGPMEVWMVVGSREEQTADEIPK